MAGPDTELIPAQDVLTAFGITEGRDLHTGYLRALEELGVEDGRRLIDKMIVADYLMANFDRHTHNFGLLRSVEGLAAVRPWLWLLQSRDDGRAGGTPLRLGESSVSRIPLAAAGARGRSRLVRSERARRLSG